MGDLRGILNSNVTDAGGAFTEEAFFAALESVMKYGGRPTVPVVSPRVVDRAHDDIERLEAQADRAKMEIYRLRHGWRRFRFIARRRAAERYLDARIGADALAGTFGRR